jgi:hypothetical protein
MSTTWERSILPAGRDNRWNRMLDDAAGEYRALKDSDQFIGLYLRVIDGAGEGCLIARDADGTVRRIPLGDSELGAA